MGRLARRSYDAVVVGTGFGGAVAACRLAQAGADVAVLERGRRFPPGSFPEGHGALGWQLGGPYDIRPLHRIAVVQASGYGGGSLIYANVQMRAAPATFAGWPAPYDRALLDPDYDLVGYMLDARPVGPDPETGRAPVKTAAIEGAAERLGRGGQAFRPNLAVTFAAPGEPRPNRWGRLQSGCVHCGHCDVGCNYGAKNTLDLNYLAAAENAGAAVATGAELTWLAPEGEGYRLRYRDRDGGGTVEVRAREVYLCMGAVNTTEFLLRARDQHRTLPRLSRRLGHGYSANGDFFAFGLGAEPGFAATRGPTITTALSYGGAAAPRFTLEDGGYRRELAVLLPLLNPRRMLRSLLRGRREGGLLARMLAEGEGTIMLLVMGRDRADGRLELSPWGRRLRIRWSRRSNAGLYAAEAAACDEVIRSLGGEMALAPNWRLLGQPSTVHNLGGCLMGADAASGVVGPEGEVWGHPGLRVLDGSIIPAALGVNPSMTVAAVAERCVRHAIRRRPGLGAWSAPETPLVRPLPAPEDAAREAPAPDPPMVPPVALRWGERMRGAVAIGRRRAAVDLRLMVHAPSVADFLVDPAHRAEVTGTAEVEGRTNGPVPVVGGFCTLFTDERRPGERSMTYVLPLRLPDGREVRVEGLKRVRGRWPWDFWIATTRMCVTVTAGPGEAWPGQVGLGLADVLRMGSSLRAQGGRGPRDGLQGLASFLRFFAGQVLRLAGHGWRGPQR